MTVKVPCFLALATVLLVLTAPVRSDAASTYKACSLLTATELEGAINAKVQQSVDSDTAITEGPFKGEVMSTCNWALGSTFVIVSIIRVQTPEQRASGLAILRRSMDRLKQQGWTAESVTVDGIQCAIMKPPAGVNAAPGVGCGRESKGFGLGVTVAGAVSVTPQQVKALTDKVVARLP